VELDDPPGLGVGPPEAPGHQDRGPGDVGVETLQGEDVVGKGGCHGSDELPDGLATEDRDTERGLVVGELLRAQRRDGVGVASVPGLFPALFEVLDSVDFRDGGVCDGGHACTSV